MSFYQYEWSNHPKSEYIRDAIWALNLITTLRDGPFESKIRSDRLSIRVKTGVVSGRSGSYLSFTYLLLVISYDLELREWVLNAALNIFNCSLLFKILFSVLVSSILFLIKQNCVYASSVQQCRNCVETAAAFVSGLGIGAQRPWEFSSNQHIEHIFAKKVRFLEGFMFKTLVKMTELTESKVTSCNLTKKKLATAMCSQDF